MPIRIPTHRPLRLRSSRPRRDETARPNAAARGYCSRSHRSWRLAVLTRDAWTCQRCGRVADGHKEAHADHVLPIAQGGARYDLANGQTLCHGCHSRKTGQEQR
jgi:5-methylcytosine-specific restriction enzyme A